MNDTGLLVNDIGNGKYLICCGSHSYISDVNPLNENLITEKKKIEKKKTSPSQYFFKNIIFFTNERDASKNKTLKNFEETLAGTDIELIVFVADEVEYKATDKSIKIFDTKTEYVIDKQSNVDTIVISRLGVQNSEECIACVKELQDWGLFVLNPIQAAQRASNKYESAVLMERHGVPQPKFVLVSKHDIRDGEKTLVKKLKSIYKNAGDEKGKEEREYVVKILDGHGGTGVFMTDEKTILGILQAIFAIDEERELLIQKKEKADGDIRVHVLTGRTKQTILAAMKRVKIKGDFRSNVSLGAKAIPVNISPEQEEIAKKVAKISGMPWCAVDIMHIMPDDESGVDGEDVVLEFNASPGTDGISEVLKDNFCTILLNAINDINELVLQPKAIGYKENIDIYFNEDSKLTFETKLDTGNGAKASTIGCDKIIDNGDTVTIKIRNKSFTFAKHGVSKAHVGQSTEERVTIIIPRIKIGTRQLLDVEFAVVDNRDKSTAILLNRDVMAKLAYVINPGKKQTLES